MKRSQCRLLATVVFFSVEAMVSSASRTIDHCPRRCSCSAVQSSKDASVKEIHVNCSGQKIKNVSDIVSALSNETTVLDLSVNSIKSVAPYQFSALPNLAVLLLQENLIREIAPGAFKGLRRLRRVDLTKNRLRTVKSDAFLEAGSDDHDDCCQDARSPTKDSQCGIDLRQNNISSVERNAFAWMKRLSVCLGHSSTALSVDAYAFYGAQDVQRLVISDVPRLNLHARLFTNVEGLHQLAISNTHVDQLKAFVFEGLTNTAKFSFTNVSFSAIESFAFGGARFVSDSFGNNSTMGLQKTVPGSKPLNTGGEITFDGCYFPILPTDAFRDTNLAKISFNACDINVIQSSAFRGVVTLRQFHVFQSRIRTLAENGFGSLRNLDELRLESIELRSLTRESFLEVTDVIMFRISFVADAVIESDAFSGCLNIGTLEISGSRPGIRLIIEAGAFRNFVSADLLVIRNFSLPVLKKDTFQGTAKIKHLKIENCNVSQISGLAFGDDTSHQGAIEHLTMDVGNSLVCNCETASTVRMLRHVFFTYNVRCTTEDGQDVEIGSQKLGNECAVTAVSEGNPSTMSVFLLLSTLVVSCFAWQ